MVRSYNYNDGCGNFNIEEKDIQLTTPTSSITTMATTPGRMVDYSLTHTTTIRFGDLLSEKESEEKKALAIKKWISTHMDKPYSELVRNLFYNTFGACKRYALDYF